MDLSPQQEIAKRLAEAGGGLAAAGRAVGLQDHQRLLRDNARRVRESHKALAKAAGMESVLEDDAEGDDMGDILVTGDINVTGDSGDAKKLLEILKGKAVSQTNVPAASDAPSTASKLGKAALWAAAISAGPLGSLLTAYLLKQDAPKAEAPAAYINDIEVVPLEEPK